MKKVISILLITFIITGCIKREAVIEYASTANVNTHTIELTNDTIITGVWDGAGKVITIHNYRIHGTGTFQNWDIDASVNQPVFDTSLTLKNIKVSNGPFSTFWYGVNSANQDNWWNLQKSINVCIANRLECHTPGKGAYKYSKTLSVSTIVNNAYQQTYLHFSGDASYWDNGQGTTFQYTGISGPAINFQLNKGSIMDHVAFFGLWKSPGGVDSVYYNLTEANYKDVSGYNLPDWYAGVTIDYNAPIDGHTRSGSTGITMNSVSIGGFAMLLAFSQNGITQNDDANTLDNIHFFDGKWAVVNGQAQEKGTSINHIYSWGSIYNIISMGLHGAYGAGNYSFDVANIAGRCIEPLHFSIGQWFSSSVSNWFCESIRDVGTFSASMPITISDCTFDLVTNISKQRNIITSNSNYVSFTGCTIRYYDGAGGDIWVHSAATFNNCSFYFGKVIYK